MPEVTLAGQKRLKAARVLCIGAGGLGSPARFISPRPASARSGWSMPIVVELSNLQRQLLHGTA